MTDRKPNSDNLFRNAFFGFLSIAVVVILIFAFTYPSDSEPLLWGNGEIRGAKGGGKFTIITKVLVPTLQGQRFWRNQRKFYSQKIEDLKKEGPPNIKVLKEKEIRSFREAVKEVVRNVNFVAKDKELQKDPVRYAEMLEAVASQIPKLEKDLVKAIKEISDLPSKHSAEIEGYEKLIRIIDKKINY
jgi:hypothetical protein